MDEVKLALELNRMVHNECKDVPHDIGLRLLEVVKKHIIKSVCRNCDTEVEPISLGEMCPNCNCDM